MAINSFHIERELFMGIDPGVNGGLAILDLRGSVVSLEKMPETERDLSEYIAEFGPRIRMAAIEHVHSSPGAGVACSFKFGMNYGGCRMALVAHVVPFEAVTPQAWQKAMGCLMSGRIGFNDRKTAKKNGTKAMAQQLFPAQKVIHATADSLLLAEHCRRRHLPGRWNGSGTAVALADEVF